LSSMEPSVLQILANPLATEVARTPSTNLVVWLAVGVWREKEARLASSNDPFHKIASRTRQTLLPPESLPLEGTHPSVVSKRRLRDGDT
jgi:hypothetical protein